MVLEYDPETREALVVAAGLRFANGLALSQDGTFAAVAETNGLSVTRVELTGKNRGAKSTLIRGLPGPPDGVSRASDGGFFVALVAAPPMPLTLIPFRWPLVPWNFTYLLHSLFELYETVPYRASAFVLTTLPSFIYTFGHVLLPSFVSIGAHAGRVGLRGRRAARRLPRRRREGAP